MKLTLVMLTFAIHCIILTRQEGDYGRYYSAHKKCASQYIDMRTKIMQFYTRLNELCGVTATSTTTMATTTPTCTVETTTAPCSAEPTLVTLYQLYNSAKKDHFLLTTPVDVTAAEADGYEKQQSPGKVSPTKDCPCGVELTPVYRLFNTNSNDHFYTTTEEEENIAMMQYGYTKEGIKFYCSSTKGLCGATLPLFRFRDGGDHVYVTDPTLAVGAIFEGFACYIWPS